MCIEEVKNKKARTFACGVIWFVDQFGNGFVELHVGVGEINGGEHLQRAHEHLEGFGEQKVEEHEQATRNPDVEEVVKRYTSTCSSTSAIQYIVLHTCSMHYCTCLLTLSEANANI